MSDEAPAKAKASQHESYGAYTVLAILLPIVGLLLGIVYMAKDDKLDRKLGEHLLALGVLFMFVYIIGWAIFSSAQAARTAIGY